MAATENLTGLPLALHDLGMHIIRRMKQGLPMALACSLFALVVVQSVGASSDDRAEDPAATVPTEVMQKFDPALRMQLRGDPEAEISAMVSLSEGLSDAQLDALRERGIRILSARERRLHVQGTADALIALAEWPEVRELAQSRPMRTQ